VGFPNGPVFAYFLAAFTRFTSDPVLVTVGIALVNVAALAASIPFFRRVLGRAGEAEMAVAIYATSPVAIWFSRKIWDPCLVPLFTVPALALAVRATEGRRRAAIAAVPVLLALAAQTHQSAAFFAVVLLAVLAFDARRLSLPALGAGFVVAALAIAPYAAHVVEMLSAHGFTPRTGSRWPDIDVVTNLLLDASGHNILQSAGFEAGPMLLWPVPPFGLLVHLAAIPFYAYFFAGIARARADTTVSPPVRRLLLGVVLGLPALYLAVRVNGVAHYFLAILPVLFALIVLGARRVEGSSRTTGWRRFAPPLPVLVVVNVLSWLVFQSYLSAHYGSEQYGLPYRRLVEACEEVRDAAGDLGKGAAHDPLVLRVDVPRDRGAIPYAYRYVLERRLGVHVRAPEDGEREDVVLTVRWPHSGRLDESPWELSRSGDGW